MSHQRRGESVVVVRKTATVTRQEVLTVLTRRSFEDLIGKEEGLELEFKGSPYRLDVDAEKFELGKDVSGLANAEGGVIVIGVRTKRHLESLSTWPTTCGQFLATASTKQGTPRC